MTQFAQEASVNILELGLFLFFIAVAVSIPFMDTAFFDFTNAPHNAQEIAQFAFTVISIGFLFRAVLRNA